jgi:hypothetical protein
MTLISKDQFDPDIPICQKHNYKGYNCPMCRADEIAHYEQIKLAAIELSNKFEALLMACEVTEVYQLLPFLFKEAKESLTTFKTLVNNK